MLAMRLLELEHLFESYRAIHEQELNEIKASLEQLREDILSGDKEGTIPPGIHPINAPKPDVLENVEGKE